jgi:hypothetical protein
VEKNGATQQQQQQQHVGGCMPPWNPHATDAPHVLEPEGYHATAGNRMWRCLGGFTQATTGATSGLCCWWLGSGRRLPRQQSPVMSASTATVVPSLIVAVNI